MTGALGKNLVFQIDISGTLTTIPCQGDGTLSFGKSINQSVTKNCTHPFITRAGAIGRFTMEVEIPANASQTAVLTASDNETVTGAAVLDTQTGGLSFTGDAYWIVEELGAPVEGIQTFNVIVGFVNDPTRGVVA